ncbi:putative DCC family thiol-disulfide oxidoreductase YuxK [Marinobacter persicus]|uniref:DCC family thiol-disulfide oxidoreductase YuxK n=2 Tax=Marinobacter persicus TaxID=930118 RepID=A0A2S6GA03_9GAMM|nr:putative DCC family thiol-disulfide oxidoreductase YuxK [Marinobacter persicus]PPK55990.1 putative DCC family thiol-disulfide oxidoreductase YuxK [Marinobacter persicus]PPK59586.1 putative DCC family thiol-disulfide oxidoreductase YuxK [Marinobacter persicus]
MTYMTGEAVMDMRKGRLVVFYDGSCPSCIKDRERYEKLAGETGESVEWLDITGKDEQLRAEGIDPDKALRELHVKDAQGRIHSEMDAYILLMSRVPVLKPLAWLIGLPVIRPMLARIYHYMVNRRLAKSG